MAIERSAELDPKRLAALADAAVEEFSARGYDAASLNKILGKAGLSKGDFYYHFRGKSGLLRYLFEGMEVDLLEKVGPIGPPPKSADAFWRQLGDAYLRTLGYFMEEPRKAALARLLVQVYTHPDFAKDTAGVRAKSEKFLLSKVEEGKRLGAVRKDLPASYIVAVVQAILEATDVWTVNSWQDLGEKGLAEMPAMVLDLIRRMVAPNAPARPGRTRRSSHDR